MDAPSTVIFGLGEEVGSALALRFFETGHHVVVAETSEKRVERARQALTESIEVLHVRHDKPSEYPNMFKHALENARRLDNLVIVPRIPKADRLLDLSEDDLRRNQFDISFITTLVMRDFAHYLMDQEAATEARADQARQRGTITFVLSHAATAGVPGQFSAQIIQSTSRAIMRSAALELAPHDIRVNAVEALRPRAERERWLDARTPLGRAALADEIADAAIFLASQKAAIITGETLVLDGGRSLLSGLLRPVPESDLSSKDKD